MKEQYQCIMFEQIQEKSFYFSQKEKNDEFDAQL